MCKPAGEWVRSTRSAYTRGTGVFAPVYQTSPLDDPSMGRVRQAVDRILTLHEPHPALLLDRSHNISQFNHGAARLFAWAGARLPDPPNALRALFDPAYGLRRCLVDFERVADEVLARLRSQVEVDVSLDGLLRELEGLRGQPSAQRDLDRPNEVALPLHLRRDETDLRYFVTLTTLGTPLDVTAQELVIEGYFPLDAETEAFGRASATPI